MRISDSTHFYSYLQIPAQMHLAITFCHADTNKPDFSTNMSLRSYQKRLKFFVIFPNNLILVPSYMQKVMANNNYDSEEGLDRE